MKVKKKFFVRMARWMTAALIVCAITATSQSFVYADETYTIVDQETVTASSGGDLAGGTIMLALHQQQPVLR